MTTFEAKYVEEEIVSLRGYNRAQQQWYKLEKQEKHYGFASLESLAALFLVIVMFYIYYLFYFP